MTFVDSNRLRLLTSSQGNPGMCVEQCESKGQYCAKGVRGGWWASGVVGKTEPAGAQDSTPYSQGTGERANERSWGLGISRTWNLSPESSWSCLPYLPCLHSTPEHGRRIRVILLRRLGLTDSFWDLGLSWMGISLWAEAWANSPLGVGFLGDIEPGYIE
jgi:hypothetical protein